MLWLPARSPNLVANKWQVPGAVSQEEAELNECCITIRLDSYCSEEPHLKSYTRRSPICSTPYMSLTSGVRSRKATSRWQLGWRLLLEKFADAFIAIRLVDKSDIWWQRQWFIWKCWSPRNFHWLLRSCSTLGNKILCQSSSLCIV